MLEVGAVEPPHERAAAGLGGGRALPSNPAPRPDCSPSGRGTRGEPARLAAAASSASTGRLVGLEDDVAELVRVDQTAQRVDGQLELLTRRRRLLADLAGRDLEVLLADRVDHVHRGQVERRQLVRVEPGPHAVVALAQVGHAGDARQPAQLVLDLDRRVVAQEDVVVPAVGRDQVDDHHRARRHLLDVDPLALDQVGDHRQCQRNAVLHEHLGHVGIRAEAEGDGQRVRAVVGALRRHVHHALDAADLCLDGRRHGVLHGLGVRPRVHRRDHHRRRGHVRVLRDGEREDGDAPRQRDDDRQHRGEDRPVDEEMRDHGCGPPVDPAGPSWHPPTAPPASCVSRGSASPPGPPHRLRRSAGPGPADDPIRPSRPEQPPPGPRRRGSRPDPPDRGAPRRGASRRSLGGRRRRRA